MKTKRAIGIRKNLREMIARRRMSKVEDGLQLRRRLLQSERLTRLRRGHKTRVYRRTDIELVRARQGTHHHGLKTGVPHQPLRHGQRLRLLPPQPDRNWLSRAVPL